MGFVRRASATRWRCPQAPAPTRRPQQRRLREELARADRDEQRARRTLVGPHRDVVRLNIDGVDAAEHASSGQARSLLLALASRRSRCTGPSVERSAVALLDDLDSELTSRAAAALPPGGRAGPGAGDDRPPGLGAPPAAWAASSRWTRDG